jgi:putative transposase
VKLDKRHNLNVIVGKLRHAEIVFAQGGTTADACRRIVVAEQTYYCWRAEYVGLRIDHARPMRELEKKNLRVRRANTDLTLETLILQESAGDPKGKRSRASEGCAAKALH